MVSAGEGSDYVVVDFYVSVYGNSTAQQETTGSWWVSSPTALLPPSSMMMRSSLASCIWQDLTWVTLWGLAELLLNMLALMT